MANTETDELQMAVLARLITLEATTRALCYTWLAVAMSGSDRAKFRDHPVFKTFQLTLKISINAAEKSISEQFPGLAKLIIEHAELSMRDVMETLESGLKNG